MYFAPGKSKKHFLITSFNFNTIKMAKTITQKVVFKNTTTKALYELYLDAKKHSIVTGNKTKIKHKIGAKFSAYGGDIKGRNLELLENELIVQSWRESSWSKST